MHKWLMAIYLLNTNLKGVSSCKLARDLNITQKTAWFLAHRIRRAFEDQQNAKFVSPIEIDESYIGGKYHNMHKSKKPRMVGAGAQDKTPVVGIRERSTGRIKAKVTKPVSGVMLRGRVMETVKEGAVVYTDQNPSYPRLVKKNYRHEAVNHSVGEYIKGQAHTTGVESFWAMLKRGHTGVYHKMSRKHLQRYIDEYAGRHKIRPLATMEQMGVIFKGMEGKRLTYRELIQTGN
ncbi:MAG: IS1595 family transposase [Candidatus Dadabacteria bacterium]|nr:IS1595 family transposase [Candidatus Dadabacteria bacterium]